VGGRAIHPPTLALPRKGGGEEIHATRYEARCAMTTAIPAANAGPPHGA
jgi:hypothetical protein